MLPSWCQVLAYHFLYLIRLHVICPSILRLGGRDNFKSIQSRDPLSVAAMQQVCYDQIDSNEGGLVNVKMLTTYVIYRIAGNFRGY